MAQKGYIGYMAPRALRPRPATEERAFLWIMLAFLGVAGAALSISGAPDEKLRQLRTPYAAGPLFDASKDPKAGTEVPLPETDVLGRNIRQLAAKARRVILAVYNGCDDCSARRSDPLRIKHMPDDLVIVVWTSPPDSVVRRAKELPLQYVAVSDPTRKLRHYLNAYWLPRYFELDRNLKVVACQSRGEVERWER